MTFETFDQSDEETWPDQKKDKDKDKEKRTMIDLWHLRHWLHLRQLRTWIHDNLRYLTIKSETAQHSQFLRCLLKVCMNSCLFPTVLFQNSWSIANEPPKLQRGRFIKIPFEQIPNPLVCLKSEIKLRNKPKPRQKRKKYLGWLGLLERWRSPHV